ncbi:MAG: DEAD/DEAH box helicase [Pseudomonadota bacterium]|nr:DEAD/DEAH box helicase [Pseudomonadota bacterium]
MIIQQFFQARDWQTVDQLKIPGRGGESIPVCELNISCDSKNTLSKIFPNGIYQHQKAAIDLVANGGHVCLATGTASGKSLVFFVAALELLIKHPKSKILAIYPLKALAKEQEDRWKDFFKNAGRSVGVGRIDGQVPINARIPLLKNTQLLIATPDIIHAWFMLNLNDAAVSNFLKKIKLIIVDEAHTYTGVFGSNAAYLFRRMRHIMNLLDSAPQFERRDLQSGTDKHRLQQGPINVGDRFVCIYDQTYGSLRLSGRIMETNTLRQTMDRLQVIMTLMIKEGILERSSATVDALMSISQCVSQAEIPFSFDSEVISLPESGRLVRVIKPGSKGLDIKKDNEEFFVDSVFYSPVFKDIAYRGKHPSDVRAEMSGVAILIPYTALTEIPGESQFCLYDLETGELRDFTS